MEPVCKYILETWGELKRVYMAPADESGRIDCIEKIEKRCKYLNRCKGVMWL